MVNSPTPAAARIALTKASATGLRRTLAMPGRASSSEEICDPPSSAGGGMETRCSGAERSRQATSALPDRQGFLTELALWCAVTTLAQGARQCVRCAPGDGEVRVRQQLAEHGAGAEVERRSEERRVGKECRSRWSPY